jgi:hypothetical protein
MSSADFPTYSNIGVMPKSDDCVRFPVLHLGKMRTKRVLKTTSVTVELFTQPVVSPWDRVQKFQATSLRYISSVF